MNCLNSLIIEGTIKEVDKKETPYGSTLVLSVDVPRTYRNSDGENVEEVSSFDVSYNLNHAQIELLDKFKEGGKIRIVGRLHQVKWTDASGKLCSRVEVIAEHIEFKC